MSRKPLSLRFIVTATLLGNTLEWYDYVCFGFLAPLLSQLFFPHRDPWAALLNTVLGIALGALLRPLGGIIFGFIGDRYGRRIALIASIILVTIPTFLIGFLPTYVQIGLAAPILLTILRIIQGLAIGGELPGAMTFIIESSTKKNRGFYGSFVFFGMYAGSLLGAVDYFMLQWELDPGKFAGWGWRIMFVFGGLLGTVAYFFRKKLHETAVFEGLRSCHEILQDPLKILFARHKKAIVKVIGIVILQTSAYHIMLYLSMIYYVDILHISPRESIKLTLEFLILLVAMFPFAGLAASRFGPKKLAYCAACCLFLFSLPIYKMLEMENVRFLTPICLAVLLSSYVAPISAIVGGLFPAKVRFSGLAIGVNVSIALSGGLIPFLEFSLIRYTGLTIAPALFLMLTALFAIATLTTIKDESHFLEMGSH